MLELIKSLILVEVGPDTVLLNVKWILFWPVAFVQLWMFNRVVKSYFRKVEVKK